MRVLLGARGAQWSPQTWVFTPAPWGKVNTPPGDNSWVERYHTRIFLEEELRRRARVIEAPTGYKIRKEGHLKKFDSTREFVWVLEPSGENSGAESEREEG